MEKSGEATSGAGGGAEQGQTGGPPGKLLCRGARTDPGTRHPPARI